MVYAARCRLALFFSALATNDSLTKLEVSGAALGTPDAGSALARALLSNATLRELRLDWGMTFFDDDDVDNAAERAAAAQGLTLILRAHGGGSLGEAEEEEEAGATSSSSTHRRRRCALSILSLDDVQAFDAACAAALGASLRRGAPLLTSLSVSSKLTDFPLAG